MNEEINLKFEWSNPKNVKNELVLGNYKKNIRTITIFLGSFIESYNTKLSIITEYFEKLLILNRINAIPFFEKQTLKLNDEWFDEFPKTVQEEFIHACIEDIRGKVEREKEEWIIDIIEETLKN